MITIRSHDKFEEDRGDLMASVSIQDWFVTEHPSVTGHKYTMADVKVLKEDCDF